MKIEERIANLETLVTSLNAELTVLKDDLNRKEARVLELEAEVSKIRAGV
jgi:phage shock protein A